ncbi:hypothetical protein MRX96_019170 [Rhipicephalus microplus]
MVRKKQQIDRAKKRTKGKGDEEEPERDSTVSHALETLQSLVFQDDKDRCKSALLKELVRGFALLFSYSFYSIGAIVETEVSAWNVLTLTARVHMHRVYPP